MYVDFGARRGRLHFSWKEVCMLCGLASSAIGYVVRAEVQFAALKAEVQECQHELETLRPRAAVKEVIDK